MTQDTNSAGDVIKARPAPTLWAQRHQVVYLTFKIESCNNPKFTFENNKVTFSGDDHNSSVHYHNELDVYDEVVPEGCVWSKKGPGIECTLQKKETGFWPRLLKDKTKMHWLKVDFNKWVDEDDLEEEEAGPGDDYDLSQMMAQMGGGPGMGGMMPDMDGLGEEEEDSDDDDLPDLEEAEQKEGDAEVAEEAAEKA